MGQGKQGYGPLEFNVRRVRLHLTSKLVGIIALRTERTQIHVLGDVLVVVVSLDLKPRANGRNIVGQQLPTTCKRVCKRTKHVTSSNVESCWPTMLRPFALNFKLPNLLFARTLSFKVNSRLKDTSVAKFPLKLRPRPNIELFMRWTKL